MANRKARRAAGAGSAPTAEQVWVGNLATSGRWGDVEAACKGILQRDPKAGWAWAPLGVALASLGAPPEAMVGPFENATRYDRDDPEAWYNLGRVLTGAGRLNDAERAYRRAAFLSPGNPDVLNNLGVVLITTRRLDEAAAVLRNALALSPTDTRILNNLADVEKDLGRHEAAIGHLRKALAIDPTNTEVYSNLLFTQNYLDSPQEAMLALAKGYGAVVTRDAPEPFTTWTASPTGPTRVGLVSGDFREHPVSYFLEAFLTQLQSTGIQVVAFTTTHQSDAMTERLKALVADWVPIYGLPDREAAATIRAHDIHVLIDLAGHTGGNRLPVFAWRPAPHQATWLGYPATTGVQQIDYVIADDVSCPPEVAASFSEKVLHLPSTNLLYTPPAAAPDVSAPAAGDPFTFGCFNNLAKVNDHVIEVWARILHRLPSSRLALRSFQLSDSSHRAAVAARFAKHGIPGHRLLLRPHSKGREAYFGDYRQVHVALDPWPYPGVTTTVDALYMGVPVVTLAGRTMLSRLGASLLTAVGMDNCISGHAEAYVEAAIALAADREALNRLRTELRARLLASRVCDAPQFAHAFATLMQTIRG